MREAQFITRMDKKVCYIDFSEIKSKEEIFAAIENFKSFIKRQPLKSLFTLTNLTNMYFNTEIYNAITKYAKENDPYVRAGAVVGLGGLMQIFYNSFLKFSGRDVRAFRTEDEAVNYLKGFE